MSCSVDSRQASLALLGIAALTLGSALTLGTALSGTPLNQLGLRPHGSNLWNWLGSYILKPVGVQGYDAIQGAMAPPLRLQCHVSVVLFLW